MKKSLASPLAMARVKDFEGIVNQALFAQVVPGALIVSPGMEAEGAVRASEADLYKPHCGFCGSKKFENEFLANQNRGSEVSRLQPVIISVRSTTFVVS